MTLLLKTCGVEALDGPDFVRVELTHEFLDELSRRRALVQRLRNADPTFDSVAFCAPCSLWFRYFKEGDELFSRIEDNGWTVAGCGRSVLPAQNEDGHGVLVRTETERIVLWQTGFRFTCCLKHTVDIICSMAVEYEELDSVLMETAPQPDHRLQGGHPMKAKRLGRHRSTVQSREHTSGKGRRIYRYVRPWISLSAKWLADAGFNEGDGIEIHSYPGALIIIKAPDADKEAA